MQIIISLSVPPQLKKKKKKTHCFARLLKRMRFVNIPVFLDCVDILDHPFSPVVTCWGSIIIPLMSQGCSGIKWFAQSCQTHSSLVRAFPWICIREEALGESDGRISYRPRTFRAESSSWSWLILSDASAV